MQTKVTLTDGYISTWRIQELSYFIAELVNSLEFFFQETRVPRDTGKDLKGVTNNLSTTVNLKLTARQLTN